MRVPVVWSRIQPTAFGDCIGYTRWRAHLRRHFAVLALTIGLTSPAIAQSVNVLTHHYDALRTGWNDTETVLSPSNVGQLQLQKSVSLDEQVDAQPLLVTSQAIANQGLHDVVYIATENNRVYAIDAESGAILINRKLGTAVSINNLLGQCNNNSALVGINSTPAIDLATQTMYLITYTWENNSPVYRLHALDLGSLADKVPAVVIGASATLSDGTTYQFQPAVNRARTGLLLANGNVYAGFGSICDFASNISRGWVLGWQQNSLTPLPANRLNDRRATSPNSFFLTGVWMSGAGIASDASGDLFFSTGNSDYSGSSYNTSTNLSESVVRLSPDLTTVRDFFTPTGSSWGHVVLDQQDLDLGSGGVLLVPDQPGSVPHLAVVAGKSTPMFLLNRDNLGKTSGSLGHVGSQGCWCAQSYFTGSDGIGRVVSSAGSNVIIWKVNQVTTAPFVKLAKIATSPTLQTGGQDPGFFTTVSSNGTQKGSAVIWAVSRPAGANNQVSLYAFSGTNASQLVTLPAGTWPNVGGNANVVPVVANGRVYVASYKKLSIFGLATGAQAATIAQPTAATAAQAILPPGEHEVYGTAVGLQDSTLTLRTRTGQVLQVNILPAQQSALYAPVLVGAAVLVRGVYDSSGVLQAQVVGHAKPDPAFWPADR